MTSASIPESTPPPTRPTQAREDRHEGPPVVPAGSQRGLTRQMLRRTANQPLLRSASEPAENSLGGESDVVIADISTKLISLPIEQTALGIEYALQRLGEFTGVEICRLMEFVPGQDMAITTQVWHRPDLSDPPLDAELKWLQVPLGNSETDGDAIVRDLISQGFAIYSRFGDALGRSPVIDKLHRLGLKSFLSVVAIQNRNHIDLLGLDALTAERDWSYDQVRLAQIVCQLISGALSRYRAFAQLERQTAIQQLVADVSNRIAAGTPEQLDDNVHYALRRLGEFTKVDIARLFFFDVQGSKSRNTHEWLAPGVQTQQHRLQHLQHETDWWVRRFQTQHFVCCQVADMTAPDDSEVRAELESLGVQSLLGVALLRDGVLVGEVGLDTVHSRKVWQADEIALVQLVAEAVNSALSRKLVNDELQHRLAFEKLVAEVSNCLATIAPEQTDQAITDMLHRIGAFFGADFCRLFQFDTAQWIINNTHEWAAPSVPSRMHLNQRIAFEANDFAWFNHLKQHRWIYFRSLDDLPDVLRICRPKFEQRGTQSRASVALWRGDAMLGELVLDVLHTQADFTRENIRLLQVVAEIIGNALNRKYSYEQLQQRLAFEHLIAQISAEFNAAGPAQVDDAIQHAMQQIGEFSGMDAARLFLLSEDGQTSNNTHEWTAEPGRAMQHLLQNLPMSDPGRKYLYTQLMQNGMVHYDNVADMPPDYEDFGTVMTRVGVRSFIDVLLRRGDDILGDLGLSSQHATIPFVAENLQLLRVVGELISNALARKQSSDKLRQLASALEAERNQLEHRVAERTRELSRLLEVAKTISLTLDQHTFINIVLRSLQEVIPFDEGAIMEITPDLQLHRLSRLSMDSTAVPVNSVWTYDPVQDVHIRAMIEQQIPVVIHDVHEATPYAIAHRNRWLRVVGMMPDTIRASIYVPLTAHDRVTGFLVLHSATRHFFDESRVALAQAFASQVAVSIDNARLHEQKVHAAAMAERSRLARELHDSVSQALFGVVLGARTAIQLAGNTPSKDAMNYVLKLSEAALAEMRALIYELRPESLETEGLVAALGRQAEAISTRHNLKVDLQLTGEEPALPIKTKEALYRIGIEAVQNTIKHALATQVVLRLHTTPDDVILEVQDDGRGFDLTVPHPGHFGLLGMRERAESLGAHFHLDTAPGQGTRVQVQVPVPPLAPA